MFHNHATSQHIYITAIKLHLNKLSHTSTQASGIKLLSSQQGGTPDNFGQCIETFSDVFGCLISLLVLGQLERRARFHMPALPNAGSCRPWNS
jgi:hypothetical protein